MQYLILGADGYIGSYLYKRLKEDGVDVLGTGHCSSKMDNLIYFVGGAEIIQRRANYLPLMNMEK